MTVRMAEDGVVFLTGDCPSGDAETLLRFLAAEPAAAVDWRECERAHTAVIQVLIAARIRPAGRPASVFLAKWVEPLFNQR